MGRRETGAAAARNVRKPTLRHHSGTKNIREKPSGDHTLMQQAPVVMPSYLVVCTPDVTQPSVDPNVTHCGPRLIEQARESTMVLRPCFSKPFEGGGYGMQRRSCAMERQVPRRMAQDQSGLQVGIGVSHSSRCERPHQRGHGSGPRLAQPHRTRERGHV